MPGFPHICDRGRAGLAACLAVFGQDRRGAGAGAEQLRGMRFEGHREADRLAAQGDGCRAGECRDVQNVFEAVAADSALDLGDFIDRRGRREFLHDGDGRRVEPVQFEGAAVRVARDEREAVASGQGVQGDGHAKLAGRRPAVREAMHDRVSGVILGDFLAVAVVAVGLHRQGADRFRDQPDGLKHCRHSEGRRGSNKRTGDRRRREERFIPSDTRRDRKGLLFCFFSKELTFQAVEQWFILAFAKF